MWSSCFVCLLLLYVLATSKVISEWVSMCDSTPSPWLGSDKYQVYTAYCSYCCQSVLMSIFRGRGWCTFWACNILRIPSLTLFEGLSAWFIADVSPPSHSLCDVTKLSLRIMKDSYFTGSGQTNPHLLGSSSNNPF